VKSERQDKHALSCSIASYRSASPQARRGSQRHKNNSLWMPRYTKHISPIDPIESKALLFPISHHGTVRVCLSSLFTPPLPLSSRGFRRNNPCSRLRCITTPTQGWRMGRYIRFTTTNHNHHDQPPILIITSQRQRNSQGFAAIAHSSSHHRILATNCISCFFPSSGACDSPES
jgi:hypothetical protein